MSRYIKAGRPLGAKTAFPAIGSTARKLKVSENHLRLVLTGRRESESLLRRYQDLRSQTKTPRRNRPPKV